MSSAFNSNKRLKMPAALGGFDSAKVSDKWSEKKKLPSKFDVADSNITNKDSSDFVGALGKKPDKLSRGREAYFSKAGLSGKSVNFEGSPDSGRGFERIPMDKVPHLPKAASKVSMLDVPGGYSISDAKIMTGSISPISNVGDRISSKTPFIMPVHQPDPSKSANTKMRGKLR